MRIFVLGGDGYLGWPQAMSLSACGHEVHVLDNFLRGTCGSRRRSTRPDGRRYGRRSRSAGR
jgi:nucleoside-diphosphate-sugar epimerase